MENALNNEAVTSDEVQAEPQSLSPSDHAAPQSQAVNTPARRRRKAVVQLIAQGLLIVLLIAAGLALAFVDLPFNTSSSSQAAADATPLPENDVCPDNEACVTDIALPMVSRALLFRAPLCAQQPLESDDFMAFVGQSDNAVDVFLADLTPATSAASDTAGLLHYQGNLLVGQGVRVGVCRLTADGNTVIEAAPRISPDGQQVVYAGASPTSLYRYYADLYLIDVDGGQPRNLTNSANRSDLYPDWSPDGGRLVFQSAAESVLDPAYFSLSISTGDLYILDLAAGDAADPYANLIDVDLGREFAPAWSPDGNSLAFIIEVMDNPLSIERELSEIYTLSLEDTRREPQQITSNRLFEKSVAWSADGTRLIFHAVNFPDDIASADVYTINLDGTEQQQWVRDNIYDLFPRWDGEEQAVLFVRGEAQASAIPTTAGAALTGWLYRLALNTGDEDMIPQQISPLPLAPFSAVDWHQAR
ncbi:MAG: hypothetical protein SF029_24680 [bacterium]|nr:hypothetical protein [bacterium]